MTVVLPTLLGPMRMFNPGSNVISTDFNFRKLQMLSLRKYTEDLHGQSTSVREGCAL